MIPSSEIRYHIPRSFVQEKDNFIVILEEEGATPEKVEILVVDRDTICSYIAEYDPPNVKSWARKNNKFHSVVDVAKPEAHLKCPNHKKITSVQFASFGDAYGACGSFVHGSCTSPNSKKVVEQVTVLVPNHIDKAFLYRWRRFQ